MKKQKINKSKPIKLRPNLGILTFDLSDEGGRADFETAIKANKIACALCDFYNSSLRRRIKYSELSEQEMNVLVQLKDEFFEYLKTWDCEDLV